MESMTQLPACDQKQVDLLAAVAADRLKWFGFMKSNTKPLEQRLEVVRALYYMRSFRRYVEPFIKDEQRVTAFEDAVIAAVIDLAAAPVQDV